MWAYTLHCKIYIGHVVRPTSVKDPNDISKLKSSEKKRDAKQCCPNLSIGKNHEMEVHGMKLAGDIVSLFYGRRVHREVYPVPLRHHKC